MKSDPDSADTEMYTSVSRSQCWFIRMDIDTEFLYFPNIYTAVFHSFTLMSILYIFLINLLISNISIF